MNPACTTAAWQCADQAPPLLLCVQPYLLWLQTLAAAAPGTAAGCRQQYSMGVAVCADAACEVVSGALLPACIQLGYVLG